MLKEAHSSSLPFPPIFKEQRIARAAQLLGFPPSLKPHGTATDSWVVHLCNRGSPFLSALRRFSRREVVVLMWSCFSRQGLCIDEGRGSTRARAGI